MIKNLLRILLLTAIPAAGAADLRGYPPVVAVRGGDSVALEDIAPRLLPAIAPLDAENDRQTIAGLFRAAVEQHLCLKILQRKLAAAGIAVDRRTAAAYIDRHCRPFGAEGESLKKQLMPLILNADFQLKAALHTYFERVSPGEIAVTAVEIENFYRLNQKRFLAPARVEARVIAVPKSRPAAGAQAAGASARLRQGEDFTKVAMAYDPAGSVRTLPPELFSRIKDPAPGKIYDLEDEKNYVIVQIRSCSSANYQPLAKAAPVIAEELAAAKMSRCMQKLLTAEFAAEPVRYAAGLPFLREGTARK